ncbi:bifunctional acetate--CoA ligase family protein/GNAT family N-acetyltransferase [Planctomyces sp. SH-PL62]|uniref:bifunctional acetate--CoA ligase family protein/GNAT family N-acetyltransferase n=1 Tax=Planctomyces sp. SH-PL62 TaxID=1636152 RepID=UPI00078E1F9C|nr:bifunctional acetate--CoA ligase family protein/GNAT family N-acetyltransferase [Planctomyces sp. SH-PL62]AMV35889.1 Succinyl-CoA ligase [ADP-forming] subunit alpha [Planctomyces sp. SH-PL62]
MNRLYGARVSEEGAAGRPLDAIFAPKTVAVVGATEKVGSPGRAVLWNLISNPFGATVFPINPNRRNVLGIKAYKDVASVPDPVDLAIVVTPAATVPGVISECVAARVKGAVVISAGFREAGPEGLRLEHEILERARRGRMRVIGPNCLGVMRPHTGMNATFAHRSARPGSVGYISQSGALDMAVLDWSRKENVGFSAFISVGSMLDVGWGDLIDYLGDDPRTKSIVIYMESIGDARAFLSASREVALTKPIIVLKAGRSDAAARVAATHTGALAGSDEVLEAAFRRVGVLRVDSIADVFDMADVLSKQPRPRGPRLAIVTNAGGPGVLATDALVEHGGALAEPSADALRDLDLFLPRGWSRDNPVDVLGDADAERFGKAVEVLAGDDAVDGLLTILTPQTATDPTAVAGRLKKHARVLGKPILACWMGGESIEEGTSILNEAGIPTYPHPDAAARVFALMWRSSYNLQGLYETPTMPAEDSAAGSPRERAEALLAAVRREGRTILTEAESKRLLTIYEIPTVPTTVVQTPEEAAVAAEGFGWPVAVKLNSTTITHKSDVGGVRLNLYDADAVRAAFRSIERSVEAHVGNGHFQGVGVQPMVQPEAGVEVLLGSSLDPEFGPVILFGSGGRHVEVVGDRALGLPPLNTTLARRMMEQTRVFAALKGVRGQPSVDMAALERLLVRFSDLVVELPWIKEIDVNPLFASPDRLIVLDARVIIHGPLIHAEDLPRPAIRPYPSQYTFPWTSKKGEALTIRPIRPEDEPMLVKFHATLSERSVSFRYFHAMKYSTRVAHERLTRICFIDYDREMALVADFKDPETGERKILGVGRLSKIRETDEAEFALLVSDQFQGRGLGSELLRRILQVGRDEHVSRVTGDILPENVEMLRVCEKVGFTLTRDLEDAVVRAEMEL